MMDWIQVLVIIGVFSGFLIYLMARMDKIREEVNAQIKDLRQEMHDQNKDLRQEIQDIRQEMRQGFASLQQYILLGKIDSKIPNNLEQKEKSKEN